ncbi:MAG: formylglycine-generating enzyme family protein [Deltaproteobacteria bacterium]|nr:formylglycine-generating enzyme family protein [Deltaproteobacteria bacterium]
MNYKTLIFSVIILSLNSCSKSAGVKDDTETALDSNVGSDSDSMDSDSLLDTSLDTVDTDTTPVVPMENEWVLIEGGTYMMGHECDTEDQYCTSMPVHSVTVPDFEILKTEVTVYQYQQCVDAGVCNPKNEKPYDDKLNVENYPRNYVLWQDANDYCEFIKGRLPSEAEWEYAARSRGKDNTYPWGEESPSCDYTVMNDGPFDDNYGCTTGLPWPVCSKPSGNTEQGLCDMAGNVYEFMADRFADGYFDEPLDMHYNGAPNDGSGWIEGDSSAISRGGSFNTNYPILLTTYFRGLINISNYISPEVGFRCARDIK